MSQRRRRKWLLNGTSHLHQRVGGILKATATQPPQPSRLGTPLRQMSGNAITSQYAGFAVEDLYLPSTTGMLGWRSKCTGALLWKGTETDHHRPTNVKAVNKRHSGALPSTILGVPSFVAFAKGGMSKMLEVDWRVLRDRTRRASLGRTVEVRGIPHLAQSARSDPDFLSAAPTMVACAAFCKESRMKLVERTEPNRKSAGMGQDLWSGQCFRSGTARVSSHLQAEGSAVSLSVAISLPANPLHLLRNDDSIPTAVSSRLVNSDQPLRGNEEKQRGPGPCL
jgi:hypothetical protein